MNEIDGENIDKDTFHVQEGNKSSMLRYDMWGIFPSKSLIYFTSDRILELFILL